MLYLYMQSFNLYVIVSNVIGHWTHKLPFIISIKIGIYHSDVLLPTNISEPHLSALKALPKKLWEELSLVPRDIIRL